jgi:NTP pyrophosphatase (non-canonical NTP hydrolase)
MVEKEIYENAIEQWGRIPQLMQAMEEASELAVALSHFIRNRENSINEVIEEVADMEIMLAQIKFMFGEKFGESVNEIKQTKLSRLETRLKD